MSKQSVCACDKKQEEKPKPSKVVTKDKKPADDKSNKGKYYYSESEEGLLPGIRKLLKSKSIHGKGGCCGCCKGEEIDKVPPTRCKIKLNISAKHDRKRCVGHSKYKCIGEIIYPFCTEGIFDQEPGVPVRRSKKSFALNDPAEFNKDYKETRIFAYAHPILTPLCPCK